MTVGKRKREVFETHAKIPHRIVFALCKFRWDKDRMVGSRVNKAEPLSCCILMDKYFLLEEGFPYCNTFTKHYYHKALLSNCLRVFITLYFNAIW